VTVPALLAELFCKGVTSTAEACASPLVPAGLLRQSVLARVARVLPSARVVAPFYLYRGRVDLAIFHRDVTIGILLEASEPFGGGVRTGRGTEPFDYTVALAAYPKDHLLEAKPPHVWGLRAYLGFDGGVAFALARPAESAGSPTHEARARLLRKAARTPPSILDGDTVGASLVAYLEARHAAIAIAREFFCGGSVADVAVITRDELHLYEIKGASDGAARLATQAPNYDRVATTCTLVTTCGHRSFRRRVPEHWGLIEAATVHGTTRFMQLRAPLCNPNREFARLVDLLAGSDLRRILRTRGQVARSYRTIPELRRAVLESAGEAALVPVALLALARRVRPA
jgi:hypothetical protein